MRKLTVLCKSFDNRFVMGLAPNLRDSKGNSFLMLTSYHGHTEAASLILQHRDDAELANEKGWAPRQLHW